MDMLLSLQDVEELIRNPYPMNAFKWIGEELARQLADTMRENGRLRAALEDVELATRHDKRCYALHVLASEALSKGGSS
jgi:hypothetical protein